MLKNWTNIGGESCRVLRLRLMRKLAMLHMCSILSIHRSHPTWMTLYVQYTKNPAVKEWLSCELICAVYLEYIVTIPGKRQFSSINKFWSKINQPWKKQVNFPQNNQFTKKKPSKMPYLSRNCQQFPWKGQNCKNSVKFCWHFTQDLKNVHNRWSQYSIFFQVW